MTETGALEYCENQVDALTEEAKQSLLTEDFDPEAKRYLLGIADYLVARSH
jgi:geranylgeranyl pyrophosphate synthase